MTFNEYQKRALARAFYPDRGSGNLSYPTLGLVGESGEVAEKVKKILRDGGGEVSVDDRRLLAKELGDVLWYLAALADELDTDLDQIAEANLEKVDGRHARGTLSGSGDDR
jgi:NTP pyrophosphatase (non-canonical NTP hydrolase)